MLVTSAGDANGGGQDAVLAFDASGRVVGRFSDDPRVADPRGLTLDPAGELAYVNAADRIVALDLHGRVVHDSGVREGLDPGGAVFGPDGRLYVTMRRNGTILGIAPSLHGAGEPLLPPRSVPFPRGFAFGYDGRVYLGSGIGPSGEGDNVIVAFEPGTSAQPTVLVSDPALSPLDMTIAPNGHILVASESPFGQPDATVTLREYDPADGALVRIFEPDHALGFRRPRGVRLTVEGHLYCVGQAHVIAFEFSTGAFLGAVAELPRLHGQAVVLLAAGASADEAPLAA